MSRLSGDKAFIQRWKNIPQQVGNAFLRTFWSEEREYLADVVKDGVADWAVRPNMVIAAALKHSPLSKEQKKLVLSAAKQKLLIRRGLRTLSPDHLRYKGVVEGDPAQREAAIHQGAAWPWLIQFFVEAYLDIHGRGGLPFVRQLLDTFEETMTEHCVGTLSEVYNGDPPHKGKGALSQAWNVAGVFYALNRIHNFK
jgi:glycogen debranching enzyme